MAIALRKSSIMVFLFSDFSEIDQIQNPKPNHRSNLKTASISRNFEANLKIK